MKKYIITFLFLLGAVGLFGQNNFTYVINANGGLTVGGATKVKVDSVTSTGGDILFWHNGAALTAVPGVGGATWGSITGTLANQIDLTNALGLKANLNSPVFTGSPVVPGYVSSASPTFTGTVTIPTNFVLGAVTVTTTGTQLNFLSNATGTTGSGNVVMSISPTITGTPSIAGYVPTSRTVNGYPLTGNVSLAASDLGLGNVTNESKTTMFTSPSFTGIVKLAPTDTLATQAYARSVGSGGGSMTWPSGSGIPIVVSGSSWGTTITNSSTNWNTAYGWGNHASAGYVPGSRTVNSKALTSNISITASDVGLGNVTNESKATMFTSPTFTGTVSGISPSMVSLGNVTNESKATMFTSPTFTGTVTIPSPVTIGGVSVTTTGTQLNYLNTATSNVQTQINDKLPIANPTATGTGTFPILKVGDATSNTITSIDSIGHATGATDISFYDGPDTLNPYIPYSGRIDLYDAMDTSLVISTIWKVRDIVSDSLTVSGGLSSGEVAAQINDTIVARLSAAVTGVRVIDSLDGAGSDYYVTPTDIATLYNDTTGIFNVLDYGAAADGTTDDVTFIQAAIDAATTVKGVVYLPAGIYGITNSIILKSNITFKGAGRGQTIIKVLPTWPDANNWEGMLEFAVLATNIKVEDLTLHGNFSAFTADLDKEIPGISDYSTNNIAGGAPYWNLANPTNLSFKNIEITKTSHFGTFFRSSGPATSNLLFDNCYIHSTGDTLYYGGMYFGDDVRKVKITNTVIDSAWQHGIYLSSGSDFEITNSSFTNNGIRSIGETNEGVGLSIRADSNVVVSNNIITGNYAMGLAILKSSGWATNTRARNIIASNNIISENRAILYPYSQVYLWGVENAKLTNNLIRKSGNTADTTYIGICFIGNNKDITISDNQIRNGRGIVIEGDTVKNIDITNNHLSYMTNVGTNQNITVGIKLDVSDLGSTNINVAGNTINTSVNAIRLTSNWTATNTTIENNIITPPTSNYLLDQSTATLKHITGNYGSLKQFVTTVNSDTIPLFVFGAGAGLAADTALFNNDVLIGSFYNSGSDTLHVTELRGILKAGTGTETIGVGIRWHATLLDAGFGHLNNTDLTVTSMSTGTVDTSFDHNDIPPGVFVWGILSGASKDNKPTFLSLTMTGYKRNRSY